jgi:hypothetical protein
MYAGWCEQRPTPKGWSDDVPGGGVNEPEVDSDVEREEWREWGKEKREGEKGRERYCFGSLLASS